jgi:O-methyltransferase involved in polyketide biosynthesis
MLGLKAEGGFNNIVGFDMNASYPGTKLCLGHKRFPLKAKTVNLILANYVFMFLSDEELDFVFNDINRVAARGAVMVVELYPAKDSRVHTAEEVERFKKHLFTRLTAKKSWKKLHDVKSKFIAIQI